MLGLEGIGNTHGTRVLAWYLEVLKNQGGRCLLCNKKGRLVIDHCHKTGKIRGVICASCNGTLQEQWESDDWRVKTLRYLGTDVGLDYAPGAGVLVARGEHPNQAHEEEVRKKVHCHYKVTCVVCGQEDVVSVAAKNTLVKSVSAKLHFHENEKITDVTVVG